MKHCLVIDDVEMNRMLAGHMVAGLGLEVIFAKSAGEALALLKDTKVDVILCDWYMPEMDGLEFLKAMRKTLDGRRTAIIIYSAVEDLRGTREALRSGADGFIPKPIDKNTLEERFRANGLI